MNFDEFLAKAWGDHATDALGVAERIPEAFNLIDTPAQVTPLAGLITHVYGEHLGMWEAGIALLRQLRADAASEEGKTVARSIASLEVASGKAVKLDGFNASYQVRILAVAASALSEKDAHRAQNLFRRALSKAEGLEKDDPAIRSLASSSNNLAIALEEKPGRSEAETELMILAAKSARQFWELAGTWLHVERAEYRLAHSYLKANKPDEALKHAKLCLDICEANQAPSVEIFFAHEALALIQSARKNEVSAKAHLSQMQTSFKSVGAEEVSWCEGPLAIVALALKTSG